MRTTIKLLLTAVILLGFMLTPAWPQQNLLPSIVSNFNIGTIGNHSPTNNLSNVQVSTDYSYVTGDNSLAQDDSPQHYAVGNNARSYNHREYMGYQTGFFALGDHTTGSGNYMIVNGAISANKKVWEYTVSNITPGLIYHFNAWVTCLYMRVMNMPGDNARPKLQLYINGSKVGSVFTVPWVENGSWTSWSNTWIAPSNATSAKITIINECTADNGNDFGLDDLSFTKETYSVTPHLFSAYVCSDFQPAIDVLSHVDFVEPASQPSLPTVIQIRKDENSDWADAMTTIQVYHGSAYLGNDNKVYYTPDEGYMGWDRIQYRVLKYGITTDARNINITVMGAPSNFVISNFPQDGYWCKGESFSQFSATCNDNGGELWDAHWEWTTAIGQPFQELIFSGVPNAQCGNYYVRYVAENACGVNYSDTLLLKICDDPVLNTTNINAPSTICEGGSLPNNYLSQVNVSNWNNDVGVCGWQVKHGNGSWIDIGNAELAQGDKLRYHAQNHCGEATTNEVTVSVTAGPEFTEPTPAFDAYYCVGEQLDLSAQSIPAYNSNNIAVTDQYWARSTDGGNTYVKMIGNPIMDMSWDGNWICYRLICACGAKNSPSPFILHVYDDPVFSETLAPFEEVFCAGDVLSANDLQAPACSGSPDISTVWQIGTSQNSGYSTLSLPYTLSRADNGKWVRLYAMSSCGDTPSNAVQLSVNDKATLTTTSITAPGAICSGGSLPSSFLNPVHVADWNGDVGVEGWWIKHPGEEWIELTSETELQNGDQVMYLATNSCGPSSTNTVTLEVTDGPVLQSTPPFNDYYCIDEPLDFPEAPAYNDNGLTVLPSSSYWAYSEGEGMPYIPITGTPTLTEEWNGRLIRYYLAYQCDNETVYAPSPDPFTLTVYGSPSLVAPEEIPNSLDTVCWGTVLADILPEGFAPAEGCHYDSFGWEISEDTDQDSQYYLVGDPANYLLPVTDNGCWIRFYVEGCGEPATSQPMRLFVGDAPSISPNVISLPDKVCAGSEVMSLVDEGLITAISVDDWHLSYDPEDPDDPSYERWEVYYNGQWRPLTTFEIAYNGCQIRYVAHNHCGTTQVVAESLIAVVAGPSFTSPNAPLPFNEKYCVSEPLEFPAVPEYLDPFDNVTDAYWASSIDGVYYSNIGTEPIQLTEGWHQRYISYILVSDCGGVVTYSTPFQLYVVGAPEVSSIAVEPTLLCEGEKLTDTASVVAWHHGVDNGSSSWQYAPASDPFTFIDFNPLVDALPAGINKVTYHAVNECEEAYCIDFIEVEVKALPSFTDTEPFDLPDFCVGTPLIFPDDPQTEGYVEGAGVWQVSTTTNQYGPYVDVPNEPLTMADNGKWIKYSVFGCDGQPVSKYGEIHMIDLPSADFEFNDNLCRGQCLNPQTLSVIGDIDYVLWSYTDSQGNTVEFSPNDDPFMELGDFYISWVAVNSCNESHPMYSTPKHIEVVQGPEFAAVNWPNPLVVCSGESLSDVLAENSMVAPQLTDPGYEPVPQSLGWFVKQLDENNVAQYIPINLAQAITERYQGAELCYAMKGDCSDDPIYSNSVVFEVKGRPVINSVSATDHYCSGESFPPADFQADIDAHHSTYTSHWQRLDGNSWTDIPGQSFTIGNEDDGLQIRYCISSSDCDFEADMSDPITLHVTGVPEIMNDIQSSVGVCAEGMLMVAEPEVVWHNTTPETGVWQVCATENGNYGVGPFGTDGIMFDMNQVARYFDGWYLRYHVEGCNAQNNSNSAKITVYESSEVQITGTTQAAVMNSFWPGVYYYYTEVMGDGLNWTLTPDIWPYQDTLIDGKSCCMVIVTQKGQATLTAFVGDGSCGSDSFVINATPFGVEEDADLKLSLYPNPARHTVKVVSESIVSVVVYDMLGQRVKTIEGFGDDSVGFSVADLPEALYLVEVQTKKGNKTMLLSVM